MAYKLQKVGDDFKLLKRGDNYVVHNDGSSGVSNSGGGNSGGGNSGGGNSGGGNSGGG